MAPARDSPGTRQAEQNDIVGKEPGPLWLLGVVPSPRRPLGRRLPSAVCPSIAAQKCLRRHPSYSPAVLHRYLGTQSKDQDSYDHDQVDALDIEKGHLWRFLFFIFFAIVIDLGTPLLISSSSFHRMSTHHLHFHQHPPKCLAL